MTVLIYIIKTIIISGLLFGYYGLFLRNRFFHGFNRFFLLSIPVISLLLPAMHFNMPDFWNPADSVSPIRLLGVGQGKLEETFTLLDTQKSGTGISREFILVTVSLLVSAILLIRFLQSIRFLLKLRNGKPLLALQDATVYFVSEKGTPFSFFKSIFWGEEMDLNSSAGQQILRHERFHVNQNHSLDMLVMEIFTIGIWFNPFMHLIRRELKAIHEYGADAYAAAASDHYVYARLLLLNYAGSSLPLTNPFFKNQIKKRITMITKSQKSGKALLGRFMILPLVAILVCLFSFKMQNHFQTISNKPVRVVIDAGHGGIDPGTTMHGIAEKRINLNIAKKIQELAKDYNVDVIMTRDKDELPGKGEDISYSLKYRAELPGRENADLFISIHTNGTGKNEMQEEFSGFDIYVPGNSSKVYGGSVKLASSIADYIKPDYTMAHELKQRTGGVLVLDNASVPSILIECGYMDNKTDLAYLQDEKNQEKIARDILEGIQKYAKVVAENKD